MHFRESKLTGPKLPKVFPIYLLSHLSLSPYFSYFPCPFFPFSRPFFLSFPLLFFPSSFLPCFPFSLLFQEFFFPKNSSWLPLGPVCALAPPTSVMTIDKCDACTFQTYNNFAGHENSSWKYIKFRLEVASLINLEITLIYYAYYKFYLPWVLCPRVKNQGSGIYSFHFTTLKFSLKIAPYHANLSYINHTTTCRTRPKLTGEPDTHPWWRSVCLSPGLSNVYIMIESRGKPFPLAFFSLSFSPHYFLRVGLWSRRGEGEVLTNLWYTGMRKVFSF